MSCVAWGPDFKSGVESGRDQRVIDVVGTVCDVFGTEAPLAKGGRLQGLYA